MTIPSLFFLTSQLQSASPTKFLTLPNPMGLTWPSIFTWAVLFLLEPSFIPVLNSLLVHWDKDHVSG